ncbi:unnamed protein product [Ambrosiozyma monospora]|uniref:Unnamed protein product n=1 Tax=Ambrosiozyma monospora TaxID=43982 RepID=A0ACB5TWU9_AMBMO|nr:unnamed protein product [Ambrosiozyma monospora]
MTKQNPKTLIILPCHAIYTPQKEVTELSPEYLPTPETPGPGTSQADWQLVSFQLESQDQISFLHHIYESLKVLQTDLQNSTLIISGGFTKKQIERSESESYLKCAQDRGLISSELKNSKDKILLEECARDSFENVLFSLALYKSKFGYYPDRITIVGFEFKRYRFMNQHLKVLQFPETNIEYIGIGPIYPSQEHFGISDLKEYELKKKAFFDDLVNCEDKFAVQLFDLNPFGSLGSKLHAKKEVRDPFGKEGDIEKKYVLDGSNDQALNEMVKLDKLVYDDAMKVYNEKCKDKFSWCN